MARVLKMSQRIVPVHERIVMIFSVAAGDPVAEVSIGVVLSIISCFGLGVVVEVSG